MGNYVNCFLQYTPLLTVKQHQIFWELAKQLHKTYRYKLQKTLKSFWDTSGCTESILQSDSEAISSLHGGLLLEGLDLLRFRRFVDWLVPHRLTHRLCLSHTWVIFILPLQRSLHFLTNFCPRFLSNYYNMLYYHRCFLNFNTLLD